MNKEFLQILLEHQGESVSGQELCEKFHVSRTTIWKWVNQLKEQGYEIEAVPNKGYCLAKRADCMTKECCELQIHSKWCGKNLEVHSEIDSTNRRARTLGEEGAEHGTLVAADCQTAGKGRLGRIWKTPRGKNIAMSLLLRPPIEAKDASMLTLVAALAVSEAVDEAAQVATQIKWPNDIVLNKKKICGILTEMSADMDKIHYVVIGIGINVNQDHFPEDIQQTADSLFLETGTTIERSLIIGKTMERFEYWYELFLKKQNLSDLMDEYEKRLASRDQEVCVLSLNGSWNGICRGIQEDGCLLVEDSEKKIREIRSGEVSVRGIYGYV